MLFNPGKDFFFLSLSSPSLLQLQLSPQILLMSPLFPALSIVLGPHLLQLALALVTSIPPALSAR